MRRRLLTTLAALSLALFAAVVVVWARSYWAFDQVQRTNRRMVGAVFVERYFRVTSSRGSVALGSVLLRADQGRVEQDWVGRYGGAGTTEWQYYRGVPEHLVHVGWGFGGFDLFTESDRGTDNGVP